MKLVTTNNHYDNGNGSVYFMGLIAQMNVDAGSLVFQSSNIYTSSNHSEVICNEILNDDTAEFWIDSRIVTDLLAAFNIYNEQEQEKE